MFEGLLRIAVSCPNPWVKLMLKSGVVLTNSVTGIARVTLLEVVAYVTLTLPVQVPAVIPEVLTVTVRTVGVWVAWATAESQFAPVQFAAAVTEVPTVTLTGGPEAASTTV